MKYLFIIFFPLGRYNPVLIKGYFSSNFFNIGVLWSTCMLQYKRNWPSFFAPEINSVSLGERANKPWGNMKKIEIINRIDNLSVIIFIVFPSLYLSIPTSSSDVIMAKVSTKKIPALLSLVTKLTAS